MKIRITAEVPVKREIRPKIGKIYDATIEEQRGRTYAYKIKVNKTTVTIFPRECEELDEAAQTAAEAAQTAAELSTTAAGNSARVEEKESKKTEKKTVEKNVSERTQKAGGSKNGKAEV